MKLKALEILKKYRRIIKLFGFNIDNKFKESIKELEELENRSCSNCFFNSSKDKNLELITCDKCLGFVNQRIFKYCGSHKLKDNR